MLFRSVQSDCLEGRFGTHRQMNGGNYYAATRQFLEAEKIIRMKSLLKYSNLNMLEVKLVFKENNEAIRRQIKQDASAFLEDMEFRFKLGNTTLEDNAILFYLSGYIARSIRKTGKCSSCNNLLIKDGASVSVNFEQMENDENVVSCKKRFFDMVNCGGLCNPSDAIFMATLHAQELFNKIFDDADTRSRFLKFKNPRAVFMECFTEKILSCENTASLGLIKCAQGHRFITLMEIASQKIFNIGGKNYVNDLNSKIHSQRKNKRKNVSKPEANNQTDHKVLKLQSDRK